MGTQKRRFFWAPKTHVYRSRSFCTFGASSDSISVQKVGRPVLYYDGQTFTYQHGTPIDLTEVDMCSIWMMDLAPDFRKVFFRKSVSRISNRKCPWQRHHVFAIWNTQKEFLEIKQYLLFLETWFLFCSSRPWRSKLDTEFVEWRVNFRRSRIYMKIKV